MLTLLTFTALLPDRVVKFRNHNNILEEFYFRELVSHLSVSISCQSINIVDFLCRTLYLT